MNPRLARCLGPGLKWRSGVVPGTDPWKLFCGKFPPLFALVNLETRRLGDDVCRPMPDFVTFAPPASKLWQADQSATTAPHLRPVKSGHGQPPLYHRIR
jgi:hypothetical protein